MVEAEPIFASVAVQRSWAAAERVRMTQYQRVALRVNKVADLMHHTC